jgi:hypothetical protein
MGKLNEEHTFQAWRAAIRARLLTTRGLDAGDADLWCEAWEAEATRLGLAQDGDYWDAGKLWIDRQCAIRKLPPN